MGRAKTQPLPKTTRRLPSMPQSMQTTVCMPPSLALRNPRLPRVTHNRWGWDWRQEMRELPEPRWQCCLLAPAQLCPLLHRFIMATHQPFKEQQTAELRLPLKLTGRTLRRIPSAGASLRTRPRSRSMTRLHMRRMKRGLSLHLSCPLVWVLLSWGRETCTVGRRGLAPRCSSNPLVLSFFNSCHTITAQSLYISSHGFGWRIHCGVEVTESSTNKQHSLYNEGCLHGRTRVPM